MAAQHEAAVTHPYGANELLHTHHLSFILSSGKEEKVVVDDEQRPGSGLDYITV
jgi:hypothetical protein